MSGLKCSYKDCENCKRKHPELSFFSFPVKKNPTIDDSNTLNRWLLHCGNDKLIDLSEDELKGKHICSIHFDAKNILTNNSRNSLKYMSVPIDYFETLEHLDNNYVINNKNLEINGTDNIHIVEISNDVRFIDQNCASGDISSVQSTSPPTNDSNLRPAHPTGDTFTTSTPLSEIQILNTPHRQRVRRKIDSDTPRKKKLKFKLGMAKSKLKNAIRRGNYSKVNVNKKICKDDILEALDDYLEETSLLFVKMQINHSKLEERKPWTDDERQLALSLFYSSPRCYKFMLSLGFKLPSISSVRTWNQIVSFNTGICEEVVDKILRKSNTMEPLEKLAAIIFDEMTIKKFLQYDYKRDHVSGFEDLGELGRSPKVASHALLFMLRGLISNWKQPLSYYLSCGTVKNKSLKELIEINIRAAVKAGIDVRVLICDMGSNNRAALKCLGVTEDTPYFFVDGRKILVCYDYVHGMKCVRNTIEKHPINDSEGSMSWEYIQEMYYLDRSMVARSCPKLTEDHIKISPFMRMRVKLAVQILSRSVAAAIRAFIGLGIIDKSGLYTAYAVEKLNNLFDCLNSKNKYDSNPYCCALSDENTLALNTLTEALDWLGTWQLGDGSNNPPCFVHFRITIKSTLLLWEDLKQEGVSYLMLNRLNQDPCENLVCTVRKRSGFNRNPTALQLRQNMQTIINSRLLTSACAEGANCEADDAVTLVLASETINDTEENFDGANQNEDRTAVLHKSSPAVFNQSNDEISSENVIPEDMENATVEYLDCCGGCCEIQEDDPSPECDTIIVPQAPETLAISYFAGYLATMGLREYACEDCRDMLTISGKKLQHNRDLLIFWRAYEVRDKDDDMGNLSVPSEYFFRIVTLQVVSSTTYTIEHKHESGIREKNLRHLVHLTEKKFPTWLAEGHPCRSHRIAIMERLVRVKVHYTIRWITDKIKPRYKSGKRKATDDMAVAAADKLSGR